MVNYCYLLHNLHNSKSCMVIIHVRVCKFMQIENIAFKSWIPILSHHSKGTKGLYKR